MVLMRLQVSCHSSQDGSAVHGWATDGAALERLSHSAMLDLGQGRDLLRLQPDANSGQLQLHTLTLVGLAQGPAVTAAAAASRQRRMLLHATRSSSSSWQTLSHRYRRTLLSPLASSKGIVHYGVVQLSSARGAAAAAVAGNWAAAVAVQQQPVAATGCKAAVRGVVSKLLQPLTPAAAADAANAGAVPSMVAVARGPNGAVQLLAEQQPVTAGSASAAAVAAAADGSGGVRWVADKQQQQQLLQTDAAATSSRAAAPVALPLPVRLKVAAKQTATAMEAAQPQLQQQHSINPESFWVQPQQNTAAAGAVGGRRQLLQEGSLSQTTLDVWTHLIWAVQRSGVAVDGSAAAAAGGVVQLTDSQLLLPQPEFARLLAASRSSSDGSFSLPLVGELSLNSDLLRLHCQWCSQLRAFPG
jgi:hypothetical protein